MMSTTVYRPRRSCAMGAQEESSISQEESLYSKKTLPDGKQYVEADRNVITGNDPAQWRRQIINYINKTIRAGKDVTVYGADGDALTITRDTAGKAAFRNTITDASGTKRLMTDEEFNAKLQAEAHIDELAETSKRGSYNAKDIKSHSFAKDGFNYRTAYFMDGDGKYYRITISVGINGSINTIYNVGRIMKTAFPVVGELTPRGSMAKAGKAAIDSIGPSDVDVKKNPDRFSIKETDSEGNRLTVEQMEFFKDSKVVDGRGHLKVMYHGTPYGGFTVFRDESNFTENKNYADRYQNPSATDFITGNHDASMIKLAGANIGAMIASRRGDMRYLGQDSAVIQLTDSCTLELRHPGDGTAYAISYKIQKMIEAMSGGEKPNILAIGHYHKQEYQFYRNVHAIQTAACRRRHHL